MTVPTRNRSVDKLADRPRSQAVFWIVVALAVTALAGALWALFRRRQRAGELRSGRPSPKPRPPQPEAVLDLQGLTEEEAAARRLEGQDRVGGTGDPRGTGGTIRFKPPYSPRAIWQANTLTIFNLSMVGLAVVQVLLGKPFDALLTTGVMLLGIGLNVGQQLWARARLEKLEQTTRPQATVVREGVVRSIDPGEVVQGDILVVGPGDQILADGQVQGAGQIVVDESMLTGDPRQHTRQAGEPVYAGSFCLAGHGAYEAQKVGSDRLIAALTGEFQAVKEDLTPLEQTMGRLLRFLLVVVAVLSLLLLADYFDLLLPGIQMDAFASAASVIFGLAPSSLFLMILVNYAMGTADLARIGALVHRSRSVESLAQATVICFARAGILTGVGLEMEPMDSPGAASAVERPRLADSRIQQILGSYARSTAVNSPDMRAMQAAFPGSQRRVREEAPFLSLYGWSAIAFDDPDLRGIYVMGVPEVLEAHLVGDDAETVEAEENKSEAVDWRRQIGRLVERLGNRPQAEQRAAVESKVTPSANETTAPALLQRLAKRIDEVLRREEPEPNEKETGAQEAGTRLVYLFAYHPELAPLHTAGGTPCLPEGLIPLCRLRYTEQVRPEAIETVQAFSKMGVAFKVFSPDAPERTATVLEQVGLRGDDGTQPNMISGPELAALDRGQFGQAVVENTIFGLVTPELEGQVVDALRDQGEAVAVMGDGANDLPAMRQAHLSITRQSSSPAALSVADIVLLEGSPRALLRVLDRGQRIANGLLDVLKLYLNQIAYLTLLILALWGTGIGFPYQSKQGSLITIASVILPSVGLSLWASPGIVPRTRLGWLLARFVAPAAVTISAAAVVVYRIFLDQSAGTGYAQLATTYLLVISGLVLVVLLRPPVRGLGLVGMGRDERSGDPRLAAMVLVLLALLFVIAPIPLADEVFGLKPLRQPEDYAIVGLAVLAWVFAASFLWRVAPLERPLDRIGWPGRN